MCGIAGILDLSGAPVAPMTLGAMAQAMRHRGPDDEGIWSERNVGLVHRRLAILDLTPRGRQPMGSDDGCILLAYNGEVYNHQSLAVTLKAKGASFQSRTDTEVVLKAYEAWGAEAFPRLNGMFALAIWDGRRRTLLLCRDRYGVKPLYWARAGDRIIFASEIKAILAVPGFPRRVNPRALSEYFCFQNLLGEETLFEGVRLLPPATLLEFPVDAPPRASTWWDWRFGPIAEDQGRTEEDWREELRSRFERAVTRQLVSDVPVGCYLSGGMDSGSIAAVASRSIPRLMTFTGGFDLSSVSGMELSFDERKAAELLSSTYLTEHYEMVLHAGDMASCLPQLLWHLEDPRVGMCYQNFYIARLASRFVRVVLAGTGGDEIFAGYPWRYAEILGAETPAAFDETSFRYWQRAVPESERAAFFTSEVLRETPEGANRDSFRRILAAYDSAHPVPDASDPIGQIEWNLNRALYYEARTFLHGLFLVEDKISMAHSLETRVPFLDNDLADFALRIPGRFKLRSFDLKRGETRDAIARSPVRDSDEGKSILRQAMRGLVPDEILRTPKRGFSPPDDSWYRGPTMDYIREILLDRRTLARGYFRPDYVQRIVRDHTLGRVNHRLVIWSLLSFEWWHRVFLDSVNLSWKG